MKEKQLEKLANLTNELTSMTYVLHYYCQFFDGSDSEITNLIEYTRFLNEKAFELYELL